LIHDLISNTLFFYGFYHPAHSLPLPIARANTLPLHCDRSSVRTCATLLASTWAVFGCSPPDAVDRAPRALSRAALRLTVETAASGETIAYADARFLRSRAIDDGTASVLGGIERSELDAGHCRLDDGEGALADAVAALPDEASLEALDAGELRFVTAGRTVSVLAAEPPALYPYVVGLEYPAAVLGPPGDRIDVTSAGGADVGRFDVGVAVAPSPVWLTVERPADGSLLVRWSPTAEGTVDVVVTLDRARALRCRTPDDGELSISARVLPADDPPRWVAIERSDAAAFRAAGADSARLELAVRRVVSAGDPE
jgi:hypothetical protein